MYPAGYMSLSWATQYFLRDSTGHGKRMCPLSFLAFGKRALEMVNEIYTSNF